MSSYGQGSLSFSPRSIPGAAPVPPFPLNSADNGLSVDAITGRIVLGNDVGGGLADLLSDREIEMAGFLLQLLSGGNRQLYIEPTTGEYFIGDVDSGGNGSFLTINDAFNFFSFTSRGNEYLRVYAQLFGQSYILGDVGGVDNGSQINIDDLTETIALSSNTGTGLRVNNNSQSYQFGATTFGNGTQLVMDDPTENIQFLFGADQYFLLDKVNGAYAFGDYTNFVEPVIDMAYSVGGTNYISSYIQEATGTAFANEFLRINEALGQPQWTLDTAGLVNNTQTTQSEDAFVTAMNGSNRLQIDAAANVYGFGQLGLAGNATRARVLDNIEGFVVDSTTGNMLSARNDNLQFGFGASGGNSYGILIDGGSGRTDINAGGDEWILIDTAADQMFVGRNDGLGVNAQFEFAVTPNTIRAIGNTFVGMDLDFTNNIFQFGDSSASVTTAAGAGVDNANSYAYLRTTGANAMEFYLDGVADQYVLDSASGTASVNINGNLGFTGTVTPVNSITVVGGIVTNVT
jgi:hypothetical protein